MKICSNCAASNVNSAEFCSECRLSLANVTVRDTLKPDGGMRRRRIKLAAKSVLPGVLETPRAAPLIDHQKGTPWPTSKRADIVFILDCTESMHGEINAIRDVIIEFVESLHDAGLKIRVGLIEFRDRIIGEEHRALMFNGRPFTTDAKLFRQEAMKLTAHGGGDRPESSMDAVMLALRQPFDSDAQKILVLITDAPPHVPDKESQRVEDVARAVRAAGISQFYLIIPVREAENQVYLHLCMGTRGIAFDLGSGTDFQQRAEDFKRTLLSLGRTISAATV